MDRWLVLIEWEELPSFNLLVAMQAALSDDQIKVMSGENGVAVFVRSAERPDLSSIWPMGSTTPTVVVAKLDADALVSAEGDLRGWWNGQS